MSGRLEPRGGGVSAISPRCAGPMLVVALLIRMPNSEAVRADYLAWVGLTLTL